MESVLVEGARPPDSPRVGSALVRPSLNGVSGLPASRQSGGVWGGGGPPQCLSGRAPPVRLTSERSPNPDAEWMKARISAFRNLSAGHYDFASNLQQLCNPLGAVWN
eukprot:5342236-Alexandrium_andersonii.AAC.1